MAVARIGRMVRAGDGRVRPGRRLGKVNAIGCGSDAAAGRLGLWAMSSDVGYALLLVVVARRMGGGVCRAFQIWNHVDDDDGDDGNVEKSEEGKGQEATWISDHLDEHCSCIGRAEVAGKASEAADVSCAQRRHDDGDVRAVRPSEAACGSRNGATSGDGDDACACAATTVAVAEAVCACAGSRVAVAPETVGDGGLVAEARSSCRLMLVRAAMGMMARLDLVTTSAVGLRLAIGVCSDLEAKVANV